MNSEGLNRNEILRLMDELAEHQRQKVLRIAREKIPGATEEDLRNPQDFIELMSDSRFNFEDGILAGLLSARTALLVEINQRNPEPGD